MLRQRFQDTMIPVSNILSAVKSCRASTTDTVGRLTDLNSAVAGRSTESSALLTRMGQVTQQLQSLRTQVNEAGTQLRPLVEQVAAAEASAKEAQRLHDWTAATLAERRRLLAEREALLASLNAEVAANVQRKEDIDKEVTEQRMLLDSVLDETRRKVGEMAAGCRNQVGRKARQPWCAKESSLFVRMRPNYVAHATRPLQSDEDEAELAGLRSKLAGLQDAADAGERDVANLQATIADDVAVQDEWRAAQPLLEEREQQLRNVSGLHRC